MMTSILDKSVFLGKHGIIAGKGKLIELICWLSLSLPPSLSLEPLLPAFQRG